MATRKNTRPRGGFLASAVSFLLVAGLVVAFFKIPSHQSMGGIFETFSAKAKTIEVWVKGMEDKDFGLGDLFNGKAAKTDLDPGVANKSTTSGSSKSGTEALKSIKVTPASNVSYNRDEWKHWKNIRNCWTVREEVLANQAVKGSAVLLDKNGKETKKKDNACEIVSGKWNDPYTGKTFTNPKDLDIDHMIPLKYAAGAGGQAWSASKKADYANSLNPGHLLAVSASANRSKSDKGPSKWQPENKKHTCAYATNWINISTTWGLSVTKDDYAALQKMLKSC